jgi:hypothetical protein
MPSAESKVLSPPLPPGRAGRKALGYASEIQRLRALGYTFAAIRRALADAGIHVCLTTVKREAARRALPSHTASRQAVPLQATASAPPPPPTVSAPLIATAYRSGKQIAEEFMRSQVTNPLIRARLESDGNGAESL